MMRTLLLFLFALAIMGSAMAQNSVRKDVIPFKKGINTQLNILDKESAIPGTFHPQPVPPRKPVDDTTVSGVMFGSSANPFSILVEEQTCLVYNPDVNALMFTCRGNSIGSIALLGTGNDLTNHYSFDHGATWSHKLSLLGDATTHRHRYPSGVIYNPPGNSDTSAIYSVMVGPLTDGTNWINTYYGSNNLACTNQQQRLIPTSSYSEIVRQGLTATNDSKFHVSTLEETNNGTVYTAARLYTAWGTWDNGTNSVTWDTTGFVPNVTHLTGVGIHISDYADEAWAPDGSVGYLMGLGSDNRPTDKPAYIPLLYKSTNGGASWTQLPYFDFDTVTAITDHILATVDGPYRPYFDEADLIVDHDGLPHIFAIIRGGYSTNIDSLNYVFISTAHGTMMDGNMFEVYMDNTNAWHAIWIDSVQTNVVPDGPISPYTYSPNNVGWTHRVQASATPDGYKVFGTWTDTDWQFWGLTDPYDLDPDLMLWGRDLLTDTRSQVRNVTVNTPLWGIAYFHFTSPTAIDMGDGYTYTVPSTVEDIFTTGWDATQPVYHYYVQGCALQGLNVGVNNIKANNFQVSTAYPNPVTGKARIDVTLASNATVSIETTNVTGQVVLSKNYGNFLAGTHTLSIDASQLTTGVYFNTVMVGDQKITNKMIVR